MLLSSGDIYEGEWKNDKVHGFVIFRKISLGHICAFEWCKIHWTMGK